jgi:uncharacterized membrane protein YraQ (UPF0718 family)/copper chaperone CopZ
MVGILERFITAIWETLTAMSPYLLFGFFVAGVLSVVVRPEFIERHLGGRGLGPVLKASLFGVPLPLCSCGVIPVAASLRRHGAGSGATTSFLISTPQTGVDSIMVTLSLLGPVFAVFRPLISFVSGLIGGSLVASTGPGTAVDARTACANGQCGVNHGRGSFIDVLRYGFVTLPRDINRALIIGVLIAGVISAAIPDDFFAGLLGGGIVSMLIMMAVGIPVYVCATASVPVAAVLIAKGVSPGAALVFLMTGPATNAATVMTVWKIMGRRVAGLYLGTVALCALAAGLLLDAFFTGAGGYTATGMPAMLPMPVKVASAVVLVAVLIATFFNRAKVGEGTMQETEAVKVRLTIKGMTCEHCARAIHRALMEIAGVQSAEVDFKKGEAMVTGRDFDMTRIGAAIEGLGYEFVGSEELDR